MSNQTISSIVIILKRICLSSKSILWGQYIYISFPFVIQDSVYLIPVESYSRHELISPKRTELTSKFKRSCVDTLTGLPRRPPPDGFCSDALVTLTSEFTSETFMCNCHKSGSLTQTCNRIGGDCRCRVNVIGKNCDKCKTGYYGFPRCRGTFFNDLIQFFSSLRILFVFPLFSCKRWREIFWNLYMSNSIPFSYLIACNCFIAGSKSASCDRYGQCSCKVGYTGRTCARCRSGHWGYPDCKGR